MSKYCKTVRLPCRPYCSLKISCKWNKTKLEHELRYVGLDCILAVSCVYIIYNALKLAVNCHFPNFLCHKFHSVFLCRSGKKCSKEQFYISVTLHTSSHTALLLLKTGLLSFHETRISLSSTLMILFIHMKKRTTYNKGYSILSPTNCMEPWNHTLRYHGKYFQVESAPWNKWNT